jgi:hypothetical protein
MHGPRQNIGSAEFAKIVPVPPDQAGANAAIVGADGGESHVQAKILRFGISNCVERAQLVASNAVARIAELEEEQAVTKGRLERTSIAVLAPGHTPRLSRAALLATIGLSAIVVLGAAASVTMLSTYVLESASPQFANKPWAAVLFSTLPIFCAVALKLQEGRLSSPTVQWRFNAVVFAIAMMSLMVFLVAAAITYAPDTRSTADVLTGPPRGNLGPVVMLLATLVAETAVSASIMAGIAEIIAKGRDGPTVLNPEHCLLMREKLRLERRIAVQQDRRDHAVGYLRQAADGRELTRLEAERELSRARELWTQKQTEAQTREIAKFLATDEETT